MNAENLSLSKQSWASAGLGGVLARQRAGDGWWFGISSERLLIRFLSKQHIIKIFLAFTLRTDFLI